MEIKLKQGVENKKEKKEVIPLKMWGEKNEQKEKKLYLKDILFHHLRGLRAHTKSLQV